MAVNAGSAFVTIVPDMKAFAAETQAGVASTGSKLSGIFKSIGTTGGLALAAGVAAGFASITNAASAQNEALNKTREIFKGAADDVEAFADSAAESFGVSKTAALEAAAGFGNILEVSGLTTEAAAKMSTELVALAGDLASFNNIGTDEALEKIRAGLVGEAEPLRTVGVLLSEARVKQEAYTAGIAKAGAELTDAQKVQARYNIILEDTASAQGDFARTSDGLANQQRILAAEFANLQAELGQHVLPVAIELTETLREMLGIVNDLANAQLPSATDALNLLSKAAFLLPAPLRESLDVWLAMKPALEGTSDAGAGYRATLEALGPELGHVKNETLDLVDAQKEQLALTNDLANDIPGLIGAVIRLKDAQRDLRQAQNDTSVSAAELREKQLAVVEAFLGVKGEMAGLIEKFEEGKISSDDVLERFTRLAEQAGLSKAAIRNLTSVIQSYIDKLNDIPRFITTEVRAQVPGGFSNQQLAEGGIVTRPTVALIGEAGPEAVIPLNRAGTVRGGDGWGSGDIVIQIDGREVFRAVREEALRTGRRNGSSGI